MATLKQKRAFDKVVENGGNVSRAMMDADYSINTANTPQKLTESKGYKELLKESGLNEELVAKSLVEDIEKKPQNRIGELRLASDVLGMTKQEGDQSKTLVINIIGEVNNRYAIPQSTETSNE